jgi:hypothetical protein
MTAICKLCGKVMTQDSQAVHNTITYGICAECAHVSSSADNNNLLEAIDAPILLMQGNPRQVVTANKQALKLFGKELHEVKDHRGGQVFDCLHSFTEAGCGKDVNCEHCLIKNAIVDTFMTASPHNNVSTTLQIKKPEGITPRILQVSTEKIGDFALVRIEKFDNA